MKVETIVQRRSTANNSNIYGKMARRSHYLSTITWNVNGLNFPIQRYRLRNRLKSKTHIHSAYKKHTSQTKMRNKPKEKGWKEIFHANGNKK